MADKPIDIMNDGNVTITLSSGVKETIGLRNIHKTHATRLEELMGELPFGIREEMARFEEIARTIAYVREADEQGAKAALDELREKVGNNIEAARKWLGFSVDSVPVLGDAFNGFSGVLFDATGGALEWGTAAFRDAVNSVPTPEQARWIGLSYALGQLEYEQQKGDGGKQEGRWGWVSASWQWVSAWAEVVAQGVGNVPWSEVGALLVKGEFKEASTLFLGAFPDFEDVKAALLHEDARDHASNTLKQAGTIAGRDVTSLAEVAKAGGAVVGGDGTTKTVGENGELREEKDEKGNSKTRTGEAVREVWDGLDEGTQSVAGFAGATAGAIVLTKAGQGVGDGLARSALAGVGAKQEQARNAYKDAEAKREDAKDARKDAEGKAKAARGTAKAAERKVNTAQQNVQRSEIVSEASELEMKAAQREAGAAKQRFDAVKNDPNVTDADKSKLMQKQLDAEKLAEDAEKRHDAAKKEEAKAKADEKDAEKEKKSADKKLKKAEDKFNDAKAQETQAKADKDDAKQARRQAKAEYDRAHRDSAAGKWTRWSEPENASFPRRVLASVTNTTVDGVKGVASGLGAGIGDVAQQGNSAKAALSTGWEYTKDNGVKLANGGIKLANRVSGGNLPNIPVPTPTPTPTPTSAGSANAPAHGTGRMRKAYEWAKDFTPHTFGGSLANKTARLVPGGSIVSGVASSGMVVLGLANKDAETTASNAVSAGIVAGFTYVGGVIGVAFGGVGAVPGAIVGGIVGGIVGDTVNSFVGESVARPLENALVEYAGFHSTGALEQQRQQGQAQQLTAYQQEMLRLGAQQRQQQAVQNGFAMNVGSVHAGAIADVDVSSIQGGDNVTRPSAPMVVGELPAIVRLSMV